MSLEERTKKKCADDLSLVIAELESIQEYNIFGSKDNLSITSIDKLNKLIKEWRGEKND